MGRGALPAYMEGWPKPGVPVRLVVKTWSGKVEHNGLALPSSGPKLITMKLPVSYTHLTLPTNREV